LKIFHTIQSFSSFKQSIVTIGTFDGVHIGHQKILNLITKSAQELNCESLVLTFFPHPRMVLQKDTEMKQLNSVNEKVELLAKLGIDNLVIHPFDKDFSRLTAEEFVKEVLVDIFRVKKIIIGYDHRFGRNRTATIEDLNSFGKKYGFEVEQISAEQINEVAVSSTKIRNALLEGNAEIAASYLGYDYSITGIVSKGKQLGRTIGFPTANIKIEDENKLIPSIGVYIAKSYIKGNPIYGMMNIGTRPTVDGSNQSIEIHFFDFKEDIYSQEITVTFLKRMRDEQKFESIDALKAQLNIDMINAKKYLNLTSN
jgi:riboflavin kinase/FMN adenylyltransferase